jgi:hypothetical protein
VVDWVLFFNCPNLLADGTNLSCTLGSARALDRRPKFAQFFNPEAYFKTITNRQARIVNCYSASQKSVNKTKGIMESQQNPNEPGKPGGPRQQGGQDKDQERQERERQQREREKQGGGHQQPTSTADDKSLYRSI